MKRIFMLRVGLCALAVSLAAVFGVGVARGAESPTSLRLTREGLAIEAGSAGHFTLNYPVFVGAKWDDVRKPIEATVSGNSATLKFDGDTRIEVVLQPGEGTLTFTPVNVPAGMTSLRAGMQIDFSYATGGAWKIGDGKETPFPAQKPPKPHIYQGNAATLTLRNFDGATLSLQVPPHSFQELTDNREWDWKIFQWQFSAPCQPGAGPVLVKVAFGAPAADAPKLVDRFGQSTRSDFPGKVKSEEKLKQDAQAEAAWLASLQPPVLDTFGGLPGSGGKLGLKRTGFFHVEKKDARWILVDPEGNAFFHLGVCAFGPSDDYTYFAGRERIYEWLPARDGEFKSAFHPQSYWNPNVLSFHLVNTIRKTGRPYEAASYTARMIERVRKWGFNSAGAFGAGDEGARRQAKFPHVAHLPLETWEGFPNIPGTHGVFDPFSNKLRERCDKLFAEKLPPAADDPLLIGYFLSNEPLYEEIPGAVAALDGTHPCKRRLAQILEEQYKTIEAFNRAWETTFASFADVAAGGLPVKTAAAKEDMRKFTGIFLDAYFRVVTQTFRKYDKNHMLIGNRLQPGTINNETLCRLSGKYLDIVSFNYYAYGLDPDRLARIRGWIGDRPMFFSEFYFSSTGDSGLSGGAKDVSTQRERGLAYRQYVEQAAALGYVVGIEWFTLVDQAVTGRWFDKYNGEAANTGLISVADRPWRVMLDEMMKTNYDIYKVFLGERAPFVFDDPRFKPPRASR
ncbi:MAG: beta-galactosidase [Verrucomicrobia bacterium]|nr:beta-galactosidase [Verrucomicrobiota bacterium]